MRFNASGGKVEIKVLGDPPEPPEGSKLDFVINGTFYGLGTPISNGTPTYALSQIFLHTGNPITQYSISVVKLEPPVPTEPLIFGLVPGSIVGTPEFFNLENWLDYGVLDQSILPEFNTPYWISKQTELVHSGPICIAILTNQTAKRWAASIIDGGNPYLTLYRYCQNSEYCSDGWNDFSPFDIACAVYIKDWPCESYENKTECEAEGCWWWNNSCHDSLPETCEEFNNEPDCWEYGCIWEGGACRAPICEDIGDQTFCESVGCYWWDGSCHSYPEPIEIVMQEAKICNGPEQCDGYGEEGSCENDPDCDWYTSGCGPRTDYGWWFPLQSTFSIVPNELLYIYLQFGGGDLYGLSYSWRWWHNGVMVWEDGRGPISEHWTSVSQCLWWLASGLGPGTGIIELFVEGIKLGQTGYYTINAPPCTYWGNEPACTAAGCYWWNNSCHSNQPESCEDLNNQSECETYGCFWFQDIDPPYEWRCHSECYWWDEECHERPPNCNEILNSDDCGAWGCYWWDGACHSEPEPQPECADHQTQTECETAGCYWYNTSCHDELADCSQYNNWQDCERLGCYWYNGRCNSEPEEWGLCRWIADQIEQPGGPPLPIEEIPLTSVIYLIDCYVLQQHPNTKPYDFIPTILEVFGVIDYFLGFDGDPLTGCDFYT